MSTLRIGNTVCHVGNPKAEPMGAHKWKCGVCSRSALEELSGVVLVRNRHGGVVHATALMASDVASDIISRASPNQLQKIEQAIMMRWAYLALNALRASTDRVFTAGSDGS